MQHQRRLPPAFIASLIALAALLSGCSPRISLLPSYDEPLREISLAGEGETKILVVPIDGVIDDHPHQGLLTSRPSLVEEVSSTLAKARRDKTIKALLLRIDSPGGSVTATDILYRELLRYKKETGVPIVAQLGGLAASGGYYVALAADELIAHPTSVVGSIGVILYTLRVDGLLNKIGVSVEPVKTGAKKDIGSPFRAMNEAERAQLQGVIDDLFGEFVNAVAERRKGLSVERVRNELGDGSIWTARQALKLGLIDAIGYTPEAVALAQKLGGLSPKARLVIYRRNPVADDTIYNARSQGNGPDPSAKLFDFGFERLTSVPKSGFYYLWEPGLGAP